MDSGETHRSRGPRGNDAIPTESQQINSDLLTRIADQIARANDSASELPPRIGKWTIRSRLGAGAMGTVFRGFCSRTGELAAIKVAMQDASARDLLRKEAEALARVQHPAIPKLFEFADVDGRPYIAVELVQGHDLAHRIHNDPPSGRDAIAWIRDVARGAHALHQTGHVHRDIKPANIVVGDDGRAFLVDFGLAAGIGTSESGLVGTLLYMAPEQVLYDDAIPATDVHALATTLHNALTGVPWTAANSRKGLVRKLAYQAPPIGNWSTTDVPSAIGPTLRRALQKDPEHRHQSAAQFADELDAVLRGSTTPSMSASERLRHRASRHRVALAATGTVVLALMTANWLAKNAHAAKRDTILEQARAAMARDDAPAAANILRSHSHEYPDDEIYVSLRREAIRASADRRFARLLAQIALAVPVFRSGYSYAPRIAEARADLEVAPNCASLVLHLLLDAYLRNDQATADRLSDQYAPLLGRNALIAEMQLILEIRSRASAVDDSVVQQLLDNNGLGSSESKCLRGIALLDAVTSLLETMRNRQQSVNGEPEAVQRLALQLLDRALEHALSVRQVERSHRCALAIEVVAHITGLTPGKAHSALKTLNDGTVDADEAALRLIQIKVDLATTSSWSNLRPSIKWDGAIEAMLERIDVVGRLPGAPPSLTAALTTDITDWLIPRIQAHNHAEAPRDESMGSTSGLLWIDVINRPRPGGPLLAHAKNLHELIKVVSDAMYADGHSAASLRNFLKEVHAKAPNPQVADEANESRRNIIWSTLRELPELFDSADFGACVAIAAIGDYNLLPVATQNQFGASLQLLRGVVFVHEAACSTACDPLEARRVLREVENALIKLEHLKDAYLPLVARIRTLTESR